MDPRETKINDNGFDVKKVRITQVRVSPHRGKWYVEYRRKNPRFWIFDKWWWYDDSIHSNYCDAVVRARVLVACGYVEAIRNKKQEVYSVKPPTTESTKFEV